MAKKRKQGGDSDAVRVFEIAEKYRTIRACAVALAIVLCVGMIAYAVVRISDKPWWESLMAVVVTAVGGAILPQLGLFQYLKVRFRRYTLSNQGRLIDLEAQLDPKRSSSGLLKDGTNPPEDDL